MTRLTGRYPSIVTMYLHSGRQDLLGNFGEEASKYCSLGEINPFPRGHENSGAEEEAPRCSAPFHVKDKTCSEAYRRSVCWRVTCRVSSFVDT